MPKTRLGTDVLTAARERIALTFDNFPRVYVSFSAGKDSTVMLHLVADEARARGRTFGVLLVDLEGQYKLTIEHAEACLTEYVDVIDEEHWVCLPLALRNAVSVYQPKWECWDPEREDVWIRPKPARAIGDPAAYRGSSAAWSSRSSSPNLASTTHRGSARPAWWASGRTSR